MQVAVADIRIESRVRGKRVCGWAGVQQKAINACARKCRVGLLLCKTCYCGRFQSGWCDCRGGMGLRLSGMGRMRYRAARSRCSSQVVFDAQWGYKDTGCGLAPGDCV
jgi:hypothetical protein